MIDDDLSVTVCVLTYNSSAFVLDTLESVKNQTYTSLCLIIADDCSQDDTLGICKKWINANKKRFADIQVLESPINTGTSANYNRGWKACKTRYLKGIAGDDVLMPNCISDYMNYVEKNPEARIVLSKVKVFGASKRICDDFEKTRFDYSFFDLSPVDQFERIKLGSCIPAPTDFYDLDYIRKYNFWHDERIPLIEDRPKWMNAILKGIKLYFMDEYTVRYRINENSVSYSPRMSISFLENQRLIYFYYIFSTEYQKNPDLAIKNAVAYEVELYKSYKKYGDLIDKIERFLPIRSLFKKIHK